MALKTKVKRESVVSEEDGQVEWITDSGKMMKAPAAEVTIVESAQAANTEAEAAQAAEEGADEPAPEPEPEKPAVKPKKEKAPPKAKQKATAPAKPAKVAAPAAPTETPKPQAEKPAKPEKEKTVASKAKKKSTAKGVRTIGGKEVDLSNFNKVKAPGGGVSYNNGDSTAKKLEGKTLDEVYKIAAGVLKVPESELRAKYKKLNPGMQRMSLDNRMRGGPKKDKKAA